MQEIPNTKYQILNTEPKYIPLSEAGKILNTSRDYMNVLVRRGKLRAVKLGRNWVTTKEWILDYQKSVGRFPVLKSDIKVSPMSDFGDLAKAEKEEFRNLKRSLVLEREKALEAKALTAILLTPEIKLTSRELHVEERKNILELVSNRFKKVDASEFEKASRRWGILKSLRQRASFKFGIVSGLIAVLFIVSFGFTISIIPGLNISGFFKSEFRSPTSGDLEVGLQMQSDFTASIFSDVFKNFPNDIPLFYRWFTLSLSKGFAFLKLKTPSELVLGELSGGEPKIIKPQEAPPRIDTFDEALALDSGADLSAGALAKAEGEEGGASVSASAFTLIENRLSVVEANLKEQNALTQSELSLQKKTILGTLGTLISISKLLPTHPISTIVVQGQPATLTTYSVQPQVNTGFDRLSADYFTLAHDATINGHLTVRSGGEFNTLSVSGATTLTGNTTIGGTLNVAGDTTLANVTVNGIFTAPNVSLTNASTTYLTVSNTAWIKEIFATQNLSVATTSATNALTVQGNTFLYGGLGVGMATTTSGAIQTTGDVFVGRNLYVSGNSTTIGQSSSDTLVVNSSVGSNLVPTLNNWYNLGSPSFYWGDAYIDTLNVNNISAASTTIGGTESATFTINTDNESIDQENMNLVFFRGTVPPNAVISWNAATSSKRFEFNQATRFFNESASTTNPVLTVQGNTGLTANAFQVLDVATTTVLFSVNPVSQKTTMVNASTTNLTVSGNLWAGSNGAFMLADGTVSNPALAFAADTDTGLFRIGDGKMSFTTNATTSLTLDTGKVIVGNDISTASYQLEVADRDTNSNTVVDELRLAHYTTGTAGNGLGTGLLFYGQDAEGAGQNLARIAAVVEQATSSATFKSGLAFSTVGSGGLLEKMRIDNAGNVGIGTTSPAGVLSIAKADSSGVTDFLVNPTVKTSGNLLDLEVGGSSLFRVASNGAVFGTGSIQITYGSVFKDSLSGNLFMPSDGFGSMFIANNAGGGNGNIQFQTLVGSLLTRMVIAAQGQVGIGSELSPANALTVNGALSVGNSSYNVTAPTNGAIIQGNVGIGTTTPSNLLSLAATTTPSIGFSVRSNTLETGFWTMGVDTADANKFKIASSTVVGTNTRLTIDGNGNVGIASTSPSAVLSVNVSNATGVANALNITSATSSLLYVRSDGNVGIGATNPDNGLTLGDRASDETGSSQNLSFRVSNGSQSGIIWKAADYPKASAKIDTIGTGSWVTKGLAFYTSPWWDTTTSVVERVRITEVGNVGIGTSTPLAQLSVQMNPSGVGYFTPSNLFVLASSTTSGVITTHFLVTGTGNVGIGTTSPSGKLHVSSSGTHDSYFEATGGSSVYLHLKGSNKEYALWNADSVDDSFRIHDITAGQTRFAIDSSGNVGIGTTSPGGRGSGAQGPFLNLEGSGTNLAEFYVGNAATTSGADLGTIGFYGGPSGAEKRGALIFGELDADSTTSVNGRLSFWTANAGTLGERVRIAKEGNVGIGTTSPVGLLHINRGLSGISTFDTDGDELIVASNARAGMTLATPDTFGGYIVWASPSDNFAASISSDYTSKLFKVGPETTGGELKLTYGAGSTGVYINSSGNVGIGTTSPTTKLHVLDTATDSSRVAQFTNRVDANSEFTYIGVGRDNGEQAYIGHTYNSTDGNRYAWFGVSGDGITESGTGLIVKKGGNVGIGTTSPKSPLHIENADSRIITFDTDGVMSASRPAWVSGATGAIYAIGSIASYSGTLTNDITTRFVIDASGNVGIGTTTPFNLLSLTATTTPSIGFSVRSNTLETGFWAMGVDTTDANKFKIASSTAVGTNTRLTIDGNGNVGIGTTNPNQGKVEVKGDTVCVDTNSDDNASSCIAAESDARLKENIVQLSGALDKLLLLRGVSFDWKVNDPEVLKNYPLISRYASSTHSLGLIAQEVQPILPEAIGLETVGGEAKYLQLEYQRFTPLIIEAIKELNAKVDNMASTTLTAANGSFNLSTMNTDLNLNGFAILNVKSIVGLNGLWSIDSDGNITAKSVNTQSLTVGGGNASGVTVYDRTTAAPKCIYIEGGVIKTSDGACGQTTNAGTEAVIETASDNTQLPNQNPEQITNNQETITNATTTPTMDTMATATTTEPILTATTTLATEPVVATSTESVIIPETSTTTTQ